MRISIELVPRDAQTIVSQLTYIKQHFPAVDSVNFPDLLRYEMRSWECCSFSKPYYDHLIPHLRAIDVNLADPQPLFAVLRENQVREVLVVAGDPPQDMSKRVYPTTSLELIKKCKAKMPGLKVYAGVDPYRSSLRGEMETIKRKIDAGADGFFTQPFFDMRFMEIYSEFLQGQVVFWGISPVTSEKSLLYWETKNNMVFPKKFSPTLRWNVEFARAALKFCRDTHQNIYFMPIRNDVFSYLEGIFGKTIE